MHKKNRLMLLLGLLLSLALIAAACGDDDDDTGAGGDDGSSSDDGSSGDGSSSDDGGVDPSDVEGSVNISGSSTVEPVSVRVAELFEDVAPGVSVTVDGPGTGDGFELFCAGATDISDASRAIKDEEAQACADAGIEFIELQVGIDGIGVMTGPGNSVECVTFGDIYALVGPESTGIDNWADANELAEELGGGGLPDASLDIFGPGEESGTFDSFIEIVLEDIADERGEDAITRPDYNPSADDNIIIQGIQSSDTSFGWVGFAFANEASDVKLLEVDGGDGCVAATPETIADNSYPVSRPLFIYVNAAAAAENPAVEAYVDFYMSDTGLIDAVSEVGYIPLNDSLLTTTRGNWDNR